jgi:3-oxoacyl-[acyl-carrier-protein] synthase-3
MVSVAEMALDRAGRSWSDVDVVVPHQANLRITKGIEKQLEDHGVRVVHTIRNYGNMSASTVPVALDEVIRGKHGPLPDPATIVLTSIGGGYAISAAVLEWRGGTR